MGNKDITIIGKDIIVKDTMVGKSNLVRVTSEEIQKHRCKAYKYII